MYCRFATLLSFLALTSASAYAQQTTGAIRGVVMDASGAAVPAAVVTTTNTGTAAGEIARTDASGSYAFPLLPPGRYAVKAEANGFGAAVHEDILVRITETAVVNFNLQVGA